MSVCQQRSWAEFGAIDTVSRSYRHTLPPGTTADPTDPLRNRPTLYAVAAQFPDPQAASSSLAAYQQSVGECIRVPRVENYTVFSTDIRWYRVTVPTGQARFAEISHHEPGHARDDAGYFESVGLTQVADRMTVTISLVWGQDNNVAFRQGGEPDIGVSVPAHPQYALCVAAAKRLRG